MCAIGEYVMHTTTQGTLTSVMTQKDTGECELCQSEGLNCASREIVGECYQL